MQCVRPIALLFCLVVVVYGSSWKYDQSSGKLYKGGYLKSTGYSGHGSKKNKPNMEAVYGGPIPRGDWTVTGIYSHQQRVRMGYTKKLGNVVVHLAPVGHNAHGRTNFRVHGDSPRNPGSASEGCIIAPKNVRQQFAVGDSLEVVR